MKKRRFNKWDIAGVSLALVLFSAFAWVVEVQMEKRLADAENFREWVAGYPYTKKCSTHKCVMKRCYFYKEHPNTFDEKPKVLYGPGYDICGFEKISGSNWYFWCPQEPPKKEYLCS